jgi:hypothetical protein
MMACLRALAQDVGTRVIVLISKPPSPAIAARILDLAVSSGKPTVVHFLGAAPDSIRGERLHAARSLAEAADIAVSLATPQAAAPAPQRDTIAFDATLLDGLAPTQRLARGLFSGGTFCYEAQLAFVARGLRCRSNAPVHGALPLDASTGDHVFIDMGDDEYTRGRPHPMIDPTLRNAAIHEAAQDRAVAVLLFDVVLGYGAHESPAESVAEALRAAQRTAATQGRRLIAIGHVCGTDQDPQDRDKEIAALTAVGAIVADSNIEASRLAAEIASRLGARTGARIS